MIRGGGKKSHIKSYEYSQKNTKGWSIDFTMGRAKLHDEKSLHAEEVPGKGDITIHHFCNK